MGRGRITGLQPWTRAQDKTEKKPVVQTKAGTEREAAGVVGLVAKTRAKTKDEAGSQTDAMAEVKAVPKSKVAAEMKEGTL
ncbi:Protein BHLHb9 [Plecturocebus cupreus]